MCFNKRTKHCAPINPGLTAEVLSDPRACLKTCCSEGMRVRDIIFFRRSLPLAPFIKNVTPRKILSPGGSAVLILALDTTGVENDHRQNINYISLDINTISKTLPMFSEFSYSMGLVAIMYHRTESGQFKMAAT